MKHSRIRYVVKVAAFNLLVSVIILAGFDIFFLDRKLNILPSYRYLPGRDLVIHRPNLNEFWSFSQIILSEMKNRKFQYRVLTDPDGCRIGSATRIRHDGPNIVIVGDSVSFGAHADYTDTVAGGLERLFPAASVWDFGVCGMDSSSYAPILSYFMAKKAIHPSVLVIGLNVDMTAGDLPRVFARRKYGAYKAIGGYLVGRDKYREIRSSQARKALFLARMALRRHSSLFNILFPVKDLYGKFAIPLVDLQVDQFPALRQVEMDNMEAIRRASGLDPQRIVVWLIPDRNEHLNKIQGRPDTTGFYGKSHLFWDGMGEELRGEGYRVVDPRDEMEHLYFKRKIYPFTVDAHLNADGFHAVTRLVAPAVSDVLASPADPGGPRPRPRG